MRLAMEECVADRRSCAVGNGIVGMVIGGRAARACDVCGKERARWYCAADLAYLCDHCDGSVHSANAVAKRHERVHLGPNGAPLKAAAQKLQTATSVSPKRDAAAAGTSPAANLTPRKKPRSIRRHKPSSVHLSAYTHASTQLNTGSSNFSSTSLIYAPANHSIMINNPRNDIDFIANNTIEFSKFVVKAEPLSPVDIGEQVKVPDHTDDDPLFESLFDFRDLQDDDLFLHQVPIYNPPQSRDHSSLGAIDSKQGVKHGKIELAMLKELSSSPKSSSCAGAQVSELSPADLGSSSLPRSRDGEGNEGLMDAKCEEPERFVDSGTGVCDLDQLDFDSMLHGDDEDGDEESDMCAFHVDMNYMDASDCQRDDGSYGEDDHSCAHQGSGMDDDPIDDHYEAVEGGAASYGEAYDFDTMGNESPRTWLCKVKVESPSEFHDAMMHVDSGDVAEAFLREKLTCKADPQSGFKLGLKLNFEDVLHAWSDRGTFWMDGQPPHQIDHCLDFLGGWLVPDLMSSTTTTEGDGGQQLVPVLDQKSKRGDGSAREASVLRYREKRRTRLFCKKIRYEVRKLNAEKRPRMKGRFVKRISIAV